MTELVTQGLLLNQDLLLLQLIKEMHPNENFVMVRTAQWRGKLSPLPPPPPSGSNFHKTCDGVDVPSEGR